MAAETTTAQCHAITQSGERCQRPAGEDGFCHQHDESDETVESYDEAEADEADGDDFSSDGGTATEESQDAEEETDASDQSQDEASAEESSAESDASGGLSGVRDVRETVQTLAPEIIGRELDAVIEVDRRDDGWLAVVEVVERPAVPDSQDILGRYEIDLDDGAVTGYRRVDRYRRSDTDADQPR